MIKRTGDVFTTEAHHIAHGVNARGVMGAGIASTVRSKYPEVYQAYRKECLSVSAYNLAGCDFMITGNDGRVIHNLFTQVDPGTNAKYDLVFSSLLACASGAVDEDEPTLVAIPMIGCGIGGLEWKKVKSLIHAVEVIHPLVEFEVWKYR